MERLTERSKTGTAFFDDDGALIRGAGGAFHQKKDMTANFIHQRFVALDKTIERLAAYEDTGLEPCDYSAMRAAINQSAEYKKQLSDVVNILGCSDIEHLKDIFQAEKDGRLFALPCKVGGIVYAITSPENVDGAESEEAIDIFECIVESATFYSSGSIQFRLYYHGLFVASFITVDDFGKTVFLTRKEAEAALEKREENNEAN